LPAVGAACRGVYAGAIMVNEDDQSLDAGQDGQALERAGARQAPVISRLTVERVSISKNN
jgi:hypothetical protein